MKRAVYTLLILFFCMAGHVAYSQFASKGDTLPENVLLEKQWSMGALLHTNGWGLKYRRGRNITALKQFMWEIEFSTYKSPKEIRSINPYFSDSRSYFYGKLNYAWFLRGGIGRNKILNRKPYWGGVQLSWLYYGGFSLGMTKPVYLYIINFNTAFTDYIITEEKYNPAIHFTDNIYGRGSFLAGFSQIGLHPGVYVKTGLDFEFGTKNRQISSVEAGATFDYSPIPMAIMAYNPKQSFFLTFYVSFMFGNRFNR